MWCEDHTRQLLAALGTGVGGPLAEYVQLAWKRLTERADTRARMELMAAMGRREMAAGQELETALQQGRLSEEGLVQEARAYLGSAGQEVTASVQRLGRVEEEAERVFRAMRASEWEQAEGATRALADEQRRVSELARLVGEAQSEASAATLALSVAQSEARGHEGAGRRAQACGEGRGRTDAWRAERRTDSSASEHFISATGARCRGRCLDGRGRIGQMSGV